MSIVLNEYEWAERMINNHDLGKRPVETLNRVAKYYLATGYSKREVRRMLDTFLIQCDPSASLPSWSDMLDKIAKNVDKYAVLSGHLHHCKIDDVQGIRTIMAGSFLGMDDYCVQKRIYGRPEQMVCVCDETGVRCSYNVSLN